MYFTVIKVV